MDFWDDATLQLYVGMQHRERVAQGEAARRLARALGHRSVRAWLAQDLLALAARLDATVLRARQEATALLTPTNA